MKKAVVIGGSNGMGLALSIELIKKGYFLEIADISSPNESELGYGPEKYNYTYTNLLYFDEDLFKRYADDISVEVLVITAGIGRIADFQFHHIAEIDKVLKIDTISTIQIIRVFYDRILSKDTFYTGVMGSIAGWMSSPSASVYSAAKAGIVRFIESVNIELEMSGTKNRILDISPSSFKGSRFYGGKNNTSLMSDLASEITRRMFKCETRFIPQYEEIFRDVLERYNKDSHEYGIYSYKYKEKSGRKDNVTRVRIGYFQSDFETITIETIHTLREAKEHCDYLIVGIEKKETDEIDTQFENKAAFLEVCKYVDKVVDASKSVFDSWEHLHFNRLFSESDYYTTGHYIKYEDYLDAIHQR